jgi:anionic cell wall polymer biosynthesis LytR-Cps2A-Psr (LCP) family protein
MIHDIGGITVDNPRAFDDTYLKPKGFPKGKIHLNGYEAMAFSRIRHNLPGGDFDRSADQQRVLRGVAARIRARQSVPGFMERGVQTVMSNMATNVGPAELFRLAQLAAEIDPSKITNCVVQGSIGTISGMSIVHPYVSQARSYGNAARNDATLGRC